MIHEVDTQWMGKMQFNALVNGHTVVMDAPERAGGEDLGSIPKPFVLTALSGCSGMEVIAMLGKSNQMPENLSILVHGEITKVPPIEYIGIYLVFSFEGAKVLESVFIETVKETMEKKCGVSHMLMKIIPITWEIKLNNKLIFSNKESQLVA